MTTGPKEKEHALIRRALPFVQAEGERMKKAVETLRQWYAYASGGVEDVHADSTLEAARVFLAGARGRLVERWRADAGGETVPSERITAAVVALRRAAEAVAQEGTRARLHAMAVEVDFIGGAVRRG